MRIIAGDFGGKRLLTPSDNRVRPTSDKVKESVFNMIAAKVPDALVMDGFAGTGSLGLEALSRGAEKVYFADNSNESISLIRQNITHCHMETKSHVIAGSFQKAAAGISESLDIIFLDPPYTKELLPKALQCICDLDVLAESGIVIAEHPHSQILPDEIHPAMPENGSCMNENLTFLIKTKERRYGNICVTLYENSSVSGNL